MIAGSWLIASVYSELTMQRSSTTREVQGNSSLTHVPACPCRAKRNSEPAIGRVAWLADIDVSRCPIRTDAGRSCPFIRLSIGL